MFPKIVNYTAITSAIGSMLTVLVSFSLAAQSTALWSHEFIEFQSMAFMDMREWGEDTISILGLEDRGSWPEELSVVRLEGTSGLVLDSSLIDLDWGYIGTLRIEDVHYTDELIFVLANSQYDETGLVCIQKDLSVKWQVTTSQPDHQDAIHGAMAVDELSERIYVFGYDYLSIVFDVYDFDGVQLHSDTIPNPEALAPYELYLINDTLYLGMDDSPNVIPDNTDVVMIRRFDLSGTPVGEWEHESFHDLARIENFQTDGNHLWLEVYEYDFGPGTNNLFWSAIIDRNGDTITDISIDFFSEFSNEDYFRASALTPHGNVGVYLADSAGHKLLKVVKLPLQPVSYLSGIDTLDRSGVKDRFPIMAYNQEIDVVGIFETGVSTLYASFAKVERFDTIETSVPDGLLSIDMAPQFCAPYKDGFLLLTYGFLDTVELSFIKPGLASGLYGPSSATQFDIYPNPLGEAGNLVIEGEIMCGGEKASASFHDLSGRFIGETIITKTAHCSGEIKVPSGLAKDSLVIVTINSGTQQQSRILAR